MQKDKYKNRKEIAKSKSKANIGFKVRSNNDFEIWTKESYTRYVLSNSIKSKDFINESWGKISEGYNFVIAIYSECIRNYIILSIPYFNELIKDN